jgi:integrase
MKSKALKIKLDTRTSRRTIPHGPKLHIEKIMKGIALGYRRNLKGGIWYARRHNEGTLQYSFKELGIADDLTDADGVKVLTRDQAKAAAELWFKGGGHKGAYTVADAAADWLSKWEGSERSKATSEANVRLHILPVLGGISLEELKQEKIENWLHELAATPPFRVQERERSTKRLSPSRVSKIIYDPSDPETIRKRKDSANRVFNDLRALLNAAPSDKISTDKEWRKIKKLQGASKASSEGLSPEEAKQFIAVCPPDFKLLVQAALITACRYTDLCQMKVNQYVERFHALEVRQNKTGEMQRTYLTDEEEAFIVKQIEGKQANDLIFKRSDGTPWKKSHQQERMEAALKAANIQRHVRFHDLRHSVGQWLAESGVDMKVISKQLGHSSVKVTESFYVHYTPEFLSRTIKDSKKPNIMAG